MMENRTCLTQVSDCQPRCTPPWLTSSEDLGQLTCKHDVLKQEPAPGGKQKEA